MTSKVKQFIIDLRHPITPSMNFKINKSESETSYILTEN